MKDAAKFWAVVFGSYMAGLVTTPCVFYAYWRFVNYQLSKVEPPETKIGEVLRGEDHTFPDGSFGKVAHCHIYGYTVVSRKPTTIWVKTEYDIAPYVYAESAELSYALHDGSWQSVPITVDRHTNSPGRTLRIDLPKLDAPLNYVLKVYLHPRPGVKYPDISVWRLVTIGTSEPYVP